MPHYHKIFIFAVLKRRLIYNYETECSFVYLIFVILLHKFNSLYRALLFDLYISIIVHMCFNISLTNFT